MNKLIVLNHKMNILNDEVYEYISKINKIDTSNNLIICPSSLYLETFVNNCSWGIGSQNVYHALEGNYTGEISTNQLKSLGVEYSIIGHYERRKYLKETQEDIRKKLEACLEGNIMPILCFGEEHPDDAYKVIEKELDTILKNIAHIEFITFAYEPAWSIDTNNTHELDELEKIINYIHELLTTKYNTNPTIIYGGSVNKDNIRDIIKIKKLSGVMIGSTSSKIEEIKDIINEIN